VAKFTLYKDNQDGEFWFRDAEGTPYAGTYEQAGKAVASGSYQPMTPDEISFVLDDNRRREEFSGFWGGVKAGAAGLATETIPFVGDDLAEMIPGVDDERGISIAEQERPFAYWGAGIAGNIATSALGGAGAAKLIAGGASKGVKALQSVQKLVGNQPGFLAHILKRGIQGIPEGIYLGAAGAEGRRIRSGVDEIDYNAVGRDILTGMAFASAANMGMAGLGRILLRNPVSKAVIKPFKSAIGEGAAIQTARKAALQLGKTPDEQRLLRIVVDEAMEYTGSRSSWLRYSGDGGFEASVKKGGARDIMEGIAGAPRPPIGSQQIVGEIEEAAIRSPQQLMDVLSSGKVSGSPRAVKALRDYMLTAKDLHLATDTIKRLKTVTRKIVEHNRFMTEFAGRSAVTAGVLGAGISAGAGIGEPTIGGFGGILSMAMLSRTPGAARAAKMLLNGFATPLLSGAAGKATGMAAFAAAGAQRGANRAAIDSIITRDNYQYLSDALSSPQDAQERISTGNDR